MILDLDDREENGVTVVDIEGKMTTTTSPDADSYLKNLLADGVSQLLLNLEGGGLYRQHRFACHFSNRQKAGWRWRQISHLQSKPDGDGCIKNVGLQPNV